MAALERSLPQKACMKDSNCDFESESYTPEQAQNAVRGHLFRPVSGKLEVRQVLWAHSVGLRSSLISQNCWSVINDTRWLVKMPIVSGCKYFFFDRNKIHGDCC